MRKRKMNPVVIIVGIIVALALAIGIQFLLPATIQSGLKRIIFFLTVIVAYFIVIFISSILSRH